MKFLNEVEKLNCFETNGKYLFLSRHEIIVQSVIFNPPGNCAFTQNHFIGRKVLFSLVYEKSKFTNEINRKRFDGIFLLS